MKAKTLSPETEAVQKRFFEAIVILKVHGSIRGLRPFCEIHGLNFSKYFKVRDHILKSKLIDLDALVYLVKDYDISADWLLTGKGNMFKQNLKGIRKYSEADLKEKVNSDSR